MITEKPLSSSDLVTRLPLAVGPIYPVLEEDSCRLDSDDYYRSDTNEFAHIPFLEDDSSNPVVVNTNQLNNN